jgi:hypothetical protein
MWKGVFPAVTTKFTEDDELDVREIERCFGLQFDAGCDGMIVCGSLGRSDGPGAGGKARNCLDSQNPPPAVVRF